MNTAQIGLQWSVAMILLLALSTAQGASINSRLSLYSHHIDAGFRITHPIISVNLLPDSGKELVAIGVDDKHQRWLGVYAFDTEVKQYRQRVKQPLPNALFAFDISADNLENSDAIQALYFLSSDRLWTLKLHGNQVEFVPLMTVEPLILTSRVDFISRGRFVRDLNRDGLDDFIISSFNQTALVIQQADNRYITQILPIQPQMLLYADGAKYTEASLYFADLNLDGRDDIVKVAEGEFEVYYQQDDGLFTVLANYLPVSLAISGQDWWNKRDAYGEALDQSNLVYRKVEHLGDINHDGLADMVVRYTKSSGVLDRVNDYEIYLGSKTKDKLQFAKVPSSVIRAEGTLTGFELVDIDNDKVDEVLVSGFDIGVSQIIGALVSGSIDQDVHLFKSDASSRFASKANITKEVELSFSLTSGQTGQPVVTFADIDGDGYQDLLLSGGEQALTVHLGEPSDSLFNRNDETLKLQLPRDGEMLTVSDLNHDGKDELIIKYGREDRQALQQQFMVIMAQ